MAASGNVEEVLYGSRHEHKLCSIEGLPPYTCSGCKAFGANVGFKCRSCPNFFLHEDCAVLPDEYTHSFFSQHPFKFRPKTRLRHHCDGCGKVLRGFVFESRGAHLKLHSLCMTLPTSLSYSGHKNHALKLVIEKEEKHRCMQCNKENLKWKYRCEMTTCNVKLDMNCAIVNFHGLSEHGISLLQRPTGGKHILEKLVGVGKFVGINFTEGLVERTGEGIANVLFHEAFDDDEGEGGDNEENGDDNEEEASEEEEGSNEKEAADNN